jgi:hypothetical protein
MQPSFQAAALNRRSTDAGTGHLRAPSCNALHRPFTKTIKLKMRSMSESCINSALDILADVLNRKAMLKV